jgi:hypothetical protein
VFDDKGLANLLLFRAGRDAGARPEAQKLHASHAPTPFAAPCSQDIEIPVILVGQAI